MTIAVASVLGGVPRLVVEPSDGGGSRNRTGSEIVFLEGAAYWTCGATSGRTARSTVCSTHGAEASSADATRKRIAVILMSIDL